MDGWLSVCIDVYMGELLNGWRDIYVFMCVCLVELGNGLIIVLYLQERL